MTLIIIKLAVFGACIAAVAAFGVDNVAPWAGQGWQGYTAVERSIEYKSNPSKHVCDARCVNATGRIMKCECSCGGKNHGKGGFIAEAV